MVRKISQQQKPGNINVLFVVSSHENLGCSGKKTGSFLPEAAYPYFTIKDAGHNIESCSPKGGKAPMDEISMELYKDDPLSQKFLTDPESIDLMENTMHMDEVDSSKYQCIFFVGGHGPLFDLENGIINEITTKVYENGGIVGAVCNGVVGFLNTRLSDGNLLIKNRKITSFTDAEEDAIKLMEFCPFPLQTRLIENGADFQEGPIFQENVVVDGRIITGQNPESSMGVGKAIVAALGNKRWQERGRTSFCQLL